MADSFHHSTRERILDAAARCFAENGYRRTRMVEVAEHAGVSRAGLYRHFPTKKSLILGVYDDAVAHWTGVSERTLDGEIRPSEAVANWLREGLSRPPKVEAMRAMSSGGEELRSILDPELVLKAIERSERMLAAVLRRGIALGEFAADLDVDGTAKGMQAALMGLRRARYLEQPGADALERPDIAEAMVSLLVRGLQGSGRGGASDGGQP